MRQQQQLKTLRLSPPELSGAQQLSVPWSSPAIHAHFSRPYLSLLVQAGSLQGCKTQYNTGACAKNMVDLRKVDREISSISSPKDLTGKLSILVLIRALHPT